MAETIGECFSYNQETRARQEKLEKRHDDLAVRVFDKLDALEEKLVSRLPVWATLLISILTLAVGILAGKVSG